MEKDEQGIDAGVFLNLVIRAMKEVKNAIRSAFRGIKRLIVFGMVFIRKNIIWTLAGTVLAFGYGLWTEQKYGVTYHSEMVVRANFGSSMMLYNKIDYFNSLIAEHQYSELQRLFHLRTDEASKLVRFKIEPVDEMVEVSKLYQDYLYKAKDTAWAKMGSFQSIEDFKQKLTKIDYPLHTVRVEAQMPNLFRGIQFGVLGTINSNEVYIRYRNNAVEIARKDEDIMEKSLASLDTLEGNYTKRLLAETNSTNKASQYNFNLAAQDQNNPELAVYRTRFDIKNELAILKASSIYNSEIILVHSEFNPVGTRVSLLRRAPVFYSALGFILSLFLVIVVRAGMYIARLKTDE